MSQALIAPKRKSVQWLSTLVLLVLPFLQAGGESLLRLDAPTRTLLFFGAKIRIEEFYLLLIAVLIVVFGFLFVTMVFGRVWCGWLCPQTTITDLVEYLDGKVTSFLGRNASAGIASHVIYAAISLLIAANLVWYFISPYDFFPRLLAGEIGLVAGTTLITVGLAVYLDIVLVRRAFCRTVCPYGRIQLMAMDRNTLTLEFDPAQEERCIRCGACELVCPMGIAIRNGLQVECINCGRCLDACRTVMGKRGREGLIHYSFGRKSEGGGRPVNLRSSVLAGTILLLCVALFLGVAGRREATIKIQRAGAGEVRRLPGGAIAAFYSAYLENRSEMPARYDITVSGPKGTTVEALGPVIGVQIAPNDNRRVDFLVKISPPPSREQEVTFRLERDGKVVATARALVRVD